MLLKLVDVFGYLSVLLRAGTLVFQSLLLGGVLFIFWIARRNDDIPDESLERTQSSALRAFAIAAILLSLVQLLYLYVNSAVLMVTADIGVKEVVGANFFIAGSVIFGASVLAAVAAWLRTKNLGVSLSLLVALVLAGSVLTNHAASRMAGRLSLIILTTLHEASTCFWIGGLPFLLLGLYVARGNRPTQWYLTQRFSRLALISVAVLAFSGIGLMIRYVGSVTGFFGTSYGMMILAKIMMLAAMLALGAINFLLLRKHKPGQVIPRLRHLVEAEVGIGITILLSAASLTSQAPAIDLVDDTVQPSHMWMRFRPEWPSFKSPSESELSARRPGEKISDDDPTRSTVAYTSEGMPVSLRVLNDLRWSEYNHHWMGLTVLGMGALALLARTGRASWAEYWPLLMIGIAIFIFVRGDPECWPSGPKSFWTTWADPEILQHRLAALLCVAIAIFELRVRCRPAQGGMLPLIFPILCAIGGALLLTHSHGTGNVKQETLTELSHMPMGVLGVMAGWSRWLELRLPDEDGAVPSWIWPVCFVLIGAGLMNYREL
jgi:putative copper resistance protein D